MNKLLIATHNPAKIEYFKEILGIFDLDLVSLADLGVETKPTEDGKNEIENALIKARFYSAKTNQVSLADDAGLYIPALNNEPGVQVRRWAGHFPDEVGDEEWLDFFLDKIKRLSSRERYGYYNVGRAVVTPDGEEHVFTWQREIIFLDKPNRENNLPGWPLESVSLEKKFLKPFSKLTAEERLKYEEEDLEKFKKIFSLIY